MQQIKLENQLNICKQEIYQFPLASASGIKIETQSGFSQIKN